MPVVCTKGILQGAGQKTAMAAEQKTCIWYLLPYAMPSPEGRACVLCAHKGLHLIQILHGQQQPRGGPARDC